MLAGGCDVLQRISPGGQTRKTTQQGDGWCELVLKFGKLFKRAAGGPDSMNEEAKRRGQGWMHAPGSLVMTGAS